MAKKKKANSKDLLLPHSKAKVMFFKSYLERYLPILCLSKYIKQINIVDAFCGQGEYLDGGLGSPIETFLAIQTLIESDIYKNNPTKIVHVINDKIKKNTDKVQNYINNNGGVSNWLFNAYNYEYEEFKKYLIQSIKNLPNDARSLIFIDPYGYKDIDKQTFIELTKDRKTEILLWLPVADIKRFIDKSKESEDVSLLPLKKFIKEFFGNNQDVINSKMSVFELINEISRALRINNLYSTSYFIQRDKVNYYALFFLTPNNLGYEKILEVKWELDESNGRGFELKSPGFFDNEFIEEDKTKKIDFLKSQLKIFFQISRTNLEIRDFVLSLEFLLKHGLSIINDLLKNNLIECIDIKGNVVKKVLKTSLEYQIWKNKEIHYEIKKKN